MNAEKWLKDKNIIAALNMIDRSLVNPGSDIMVS